MITVKVPATSANLGPGFDCLGLAVDLYNIFKVEEITSGLELIGFEDKFTNENNLVYLAMKYIFDLQNVPCPGIRIEIEVNVPESRGLGSSTTCIIGGMLAANQMIGNPYSHDDIFELATKMEGHPDNVAPAMYGGLSTSFMGEDVILSAQIPIKEGIKLIALIPDFTLSTEKARAVLPKEIAYKTAIHNASRVALLIAALHSGKKNQLRIALKDEMHQPFRGKLIKYYDRVMEDLYKTEIYGAYLSGAGPTIMAIVDETDNQTIDLIRSFTPSGWDVKELSIITEGAKVYGS